MTYGVHSGGSHLGGKALNVSVVYVCVCVQDTFCLTFSVEMDFFGDLRTIGLKQGGEDVPVTEENRHEYVELMVDYLLNR